MEDERWSVCSDEKRKVRISPAGERLGVIVLRFWGKDL